MISRSALLLSQRFVASVGFASRNLLKTTRFHRNNTFALGSQMLISTPRFSFASNLPKHEVLTMPALSPTMKTGKVVLWGKKVGDAVEAGDMLCEVETDKATVAFELQDRGFIAKILLSGEDQIPVGQPVAIIVNKKEDIAAFENYTVSSSAPSAPTPAPKAAQSAPKKESSAPAPSTNYPPHEVHKLPALSPTVKVAKIVKWNYKVGDAFNEGDSLCEVETDKATVGYEALERGVVAKILGNEGQEFPVGHPILVTVKDPSVVGQFKDFTVGAQSQSSTPAPSKSEASQQAPSTSKTQETITTSAPKSDSGARIFASPLAKGLANEKGVDLREIQGSGPEGRIIKQDVENYTPRAQPQKEAVASTSAPASSTAQTAPSAPAPKKTAAKVSVPENPFEEISLSSMRKTIAARLLESKTTIPHYYISADITMDELLKAREEINKNEKEHGVKVSVNDFIMKATALALRDYPDCNAQWNTNTIKKFRYADVAMAVATDSGLITPIVFRADTKGLLEIAKNTKDLSKRAREGKLQPLEFVGGTCSVSNLGMFGVSNVISVINPPHSMILGVGKTEKKIVFDEASTNVDKPYKVSNMMTVTVSADHRVVDGALAGQWLMRLKRYLENPLHLML